MLPESGGDAAVETPAYIEQDAPEAPVAETPAEEPKAPEQEAAEGTDEQDGSLDQVRKPRVGGFKRKLAQKDAEIARLNAALAAQQAAPATQPAGEPTPDNYKNWDDYTKALTKYTAEQVVKETLSERDQTSKKQTATETWNNRADEARKLYEDYDDALASFDDVPVRKDITDALLESEVGPKVAYYFTEHPEELDAINKGGVSPFAIAKAITRIEGIVGGDKGGKAAVRTTKSPPPITPVKPLSTKVADAHPRGYIEVA